MTKQNRYFYIFFLTLSVQLSSCKKFIEVDSPNTNLNARNVYTTDATAAAVLTQIYADMSGSNINLISSNITSLSLYTALGADELTLYDLNAIDLTPYYQNTLNKSQVHNYWIPIYKYIFATNNAIDGLNGTITLTPVVKQQLLGEAKFMRAFCYFYLVNLYGEVPLVLDLNYKINALLSRATIRQVYGQIIADLKDAQELLSTNYLKGDALNSYEAGAEERVRPTRWAATTLLARVYLYTGDWTNAEIEATKVVDNSTSFRLEPLNNVFLKNNHEAIWQLQPVGLDALANTGEGRLFILPNSGPRAVDNPVYLKDVLVNDFEAGDKRKNNWIDSVKVNGLIYYYPYKYKVGNLAAPTSEYPTILRLAELFLIRAEARAQLNKIIGAQEDLNAIRTRAGLSNTASADQASLLKAIMQERRVEFFTEWAHRWLDLKRSGAIDSVMTNVAPTKGGSWQSFQALYPIPEKDILVNPNLVQNPQY